MASAARQRRRAPAPLDPWTRWAYAPHTVSLMAVGLAALAWKSGALEPRPEDMNTMDMGRRGALGAALVVVLHSLAHGPPSHFIRPHPAWYRLLHGVATCYACALVFVMCHSTSEARQLMRYLDPSLGKPLEEFSYGADCRVHTPGHPDGPFAGVKATVLDRFVIAHILGWWGKAVALRDYRVLWTVSVMFELLELTFKHWLKNFNECWWDSWVLDVMLCNWLGMKLGMWTVRQWETDGTYEWLGLSKTPGGLAKLKRAALQFTPVRVEPFDWGYTSTPKRFLQTALLVAGVLAMELNAFFLKTILWVGPEHALNGLRLWLWFFLSMPAVREYYVFITFGGGLWSMNKIGPYAWLALLLTALETMVIVKHGKGQFPDPWPPEVVRAWSAVAAVGTVLLVAWQARRLMGRV